MSESPHDTVLESEYPEHEHEHGEEEHAHDHDHEGDGVLETTRGCGNRCADCLACKKRETQTEGD